MPTECGKLTEEMAVKLILRPIPYEKNSTHPRRPCASFVPFPLFPAFTLFTSFAGTSIARADTISLSITQQASGTIGNQSFTNQNVTYTGIFSSQQLLS
jgi:hypothetical protein